MILPSGSMIASARSWAGKTRPLFVTMSSSPAQGLPLSMVSNISLAVPGSLTTAGPPPAASISSAVSYPNKADEASFWKMWCPWASEIPMASLADSTAFMMYCSRCSACLRAETSLKVR